MDISKHKQDVEEKGYTIINDIFSSEQTENIIQRINETNHSGHNTTATKDLYAIRRLFHEIATLKQLVFTNKMLHLVKNLFGEDYFLVKAIYFDKPSLSNWVVAWHQDLYISVDKKSTTTGFNHWTVKNDQFNVQPPVTFLESIFTIRIHLDRCTSENGALLVIPGSHNSGITHVSSLPPDGETVCEVEQGGIMIMKPLLLHASRRSTTNRNRRVLHLEFCNRSLPEPLNWAEKEMIF